MDPKKLDPICIELNNKSYATILDTHKNLRNLVDPTEATIFESYDYTAFGQKLNSPNSSKNPWRYFGKRWDTESETYYFGKRHYDPELAKWLSPDPLGSRDSTNLYQYVFNDPFSYADPEGEFVVIAIPLLIWGAEIVVPTLYVVGYTAATAAVLYTGVKAVEAINDSALWKNTNPFDGPIGEEIFIGDISGNTIPVPEDHQLEGTKDGKWIQVKDKDRIPTGIRKDGGGHPREKDIRGREPHGHVPGVSNPDGTPWLQIH